MPSDLDAFAARVLACLVEAYQAREGMKSRTRSLSEYELARRLGITQYSYAEFEQSPERASLLAALDLLARQGRVQRGSPSGRYDTFAPCEPIQPSGAAPSPPAVAEPTTQALLERLSRQLDEVLAVLRSIDRKLGPE
jgi:hypothetical protein